MSPAYIHELRQNRDSSACLLSVILMPRYRCFRILHSSLVKLVMKVQSVGSFTFVVGHPCWRYPSGKIVFRNKTDAGKKDHNKNTN